MMGFVPKMLFSTNSYYPIIREEPEHYVLNPYGVEWTVRKSDGLVEQGNWFLQIPSDSDEETKLKNNLDYLNLVHKVQSKLSSVSNRRLSSPSTGDLTLDWSEYTLTALLEHLEALEVLLDPENNK